jgi:hypothetical protein
MNHLFRNGDLTDLSIYLIGMACVGGNAIVAPAAQAFIEAYLEVTNLLPLTGNVNDKQGG